ncbi:MAG: hypothetical protein IPI19_11295 [Ignavibacteriales bacterium]|nr:hypothetical protein [Ignavibacteriales bacterium]
MKKYSHSYISFFFIILSVNASAQIIQSSWSVNQSLAAYSLDKNNGSEL